MTVYADTSALVKRYIVEPGSRGVIEMTATATLVATAVVTRAEVAAAFARAVRMGVVDPAAAKQAQNRFLRDWPGFARVSVTEALVARADALAWEFALRGYDAVQLASAITFRDSIGRDVVLASFDRQLWEASTQTGFEVWPTRLPGGRS